MGLAAQTAQCLRESEERLRNIETILERMTASVRMERLAIREIVSRLESGPEIPVGAQMGQVGVSSALGTGAAGKAAEYLASQDRADGS